MCEDTMIAIEGIPSTVFEVAVVTNYYEHYSKVLKENFIGIYWISIVSSDIWPAEKVLESNSLES